MHSRHIVTIAMMCLLFLFANCDTMDDVKKMESETNNLTLVYASGGGGVVSKVCKAGSMPISLGGSSSEIFVNSYSQENYFVVNVPDPVPSSGNLTISTSGTSGLIGFLKDYDCNDFNQNGDWSGDILMTSHLTQGGKYWIRIWASDSDGTSYRVYANIP
jgi:hypothetical protein